MVHHRLVPLRVPDVVPCGEEMTRVQAVPDPRGVPHRLTHRPEVFKAVAQRCALPRRGLQAHHYIRGIGRFRAGV